MLPTRRKGVIRPNDESPNDSLSPCNLLHSDIRARGARWVFLLQNDILLGQLVVKVCHEQLGRVGRREGEPESSGGIVQVASLGL